MGLLINLSGVGPRTTGLGVYAAMCGQMLEANFIARTLHNTTFRPFDTRSVESPESVALGANKLSALRRYRFLSSVQVPPNALLYSPSHHYVPNAAHQVVTIADLISLRHPWQHPSQSLFFRFGVAKSARRAASVFTISHSVRLELCETFDLDPDRIHVVSPSIRKEQFGAGLTTAPRRGRPFLLSIGGRFAHKNIHELLERHALWRGDYALKIASCAGSYRGRLEVLIARLGLQNDVELLGYVGHAELVGLYRNCSALVYPSKTEGFGIPPLEALACGSPIIVSDIPVHREVCGDAAIYVQLGYASSWMRAFASLDDRTLVAEKLLNAKARLDEYSPVNVERALVQAIESVAAREGVQLERQ